MLTIKNWASRVWWRATGLMILLVLLAGCVPSGPRALLDGERLLKEGRLPQAIAKLQRAAQLLPNNAQAWNHLGLALHRAGQLDAALQAYERARRCDLNLTPVRFNLGCLLLDRNEPQNAAAELTSYTLLQSDSVEGWAKLGTAQLRLRQWDAAERSFQQALRLQPDLPEAWDGLGVSQAQRRRSRDAWNSFHAALRKRPDYAPAILNLAVLEQHALNDPAQALQRYQEFLKLQPGSPQTAAIQENVRELEAKLRPPPRVEPATPVAVVPKEHERPAPTPRPRPASPVVARAPAPTPGLSNPPDLAESPRVPAPKLIASAERATLPKAESPVPRKEEATRPPETREPEKPSKTEANPVPSPVPAPAPAAPAAVEVVRVDAQPHPRLAEDQGEATARETTESNGPNQAAPPSAPGLSQIDQASALLAKAIEENPPAEPEEPPKRHVLEHLNPANWFRGGRRKTVTPTLLEPVPAIQSAAAPEFTEVVQSRSALSASRLPPLEPVKRYTYLRLPPLRPGERAKANPVFAEAVQEHRDGRFKEAIESYRKAIRLDPSFFEAHYNLGLAAYESHDLGQALSADETALAINPTSVNARYNFALALKQGGYYQDAANELEKLLQENPDEARAHLALASLYAAKLGEPAAARPHYRRVLELEPQHPQAPAIRYWLATNP